MDATCHYCERPARFAVTLRSRATELAMDQRQRLCEAHDAIVSTLPSVSILERRPWHVLPPTETAGTVIAAGVDRSTLVQSTAWTASGVGAAPPGGARGQRPATPRRRLLRSLVGR